MLSRSVGIHRTPGESPRPAPVRPADGPADGLSRLRGRTIGTGIVLAALAGTLLLFLLLNMNGVVEPRVRLLMFSYERPGVLPVMLITAVLSAMCTVAAGAMFQARTQLGEARRRSLTAVVEHEASRVKNGPALNRASPQPVAAS